MIKQRIEQAIAAALPGARFVVERPANMTHGDYSTNAALVGKVDPNELVAKLGAIEGVERIEVAGRFVNFFLSYKALLPKEEPLPQPNAGKTIMVEYTDPNPFKEFHIGHLMSNAIGEAIARLLERSGAAVTRVTFQGDVGLHVAKAIWGKLEKPDLGWGEAYVYGSNEYEANKEAIDAINKKVYEQSDPEIQALYAAGRAESLARFEDIYRKLGSAFAHYFFESETAPKGKEIVLGHPDVFVESDGARVFRGEEQGLHTRVFLTSQGIPTYEAKDLGLLALKQAFGSFEESISITANEQNEYFKVVLAAAGHVAELREIAAKTTHISHGMMRFASGKMSSRKGNIITGESLLSELIDDSKEKMHGREVGNADLVAQQVAVGAIKYAILKQGSGKDIIFDPEKSLSLEGDSGPYLQYAHTRAASLAREAAKAGIEPGVSDAPAEVAALERILVHYPEVVERAARELEPHHLTTFLTELAGAFNSWYASTRVIGGPYPHYGTHLVQAVERTLRQGLDTLGIPVPEEM